MRAYCRRTFPGIRQTSVPNEQDGVTNPDPRHEREGVELEDRLAVVLGNAREIDVQIFVQATADADHRALLLARFVETNLGVDLVNDFAVFRDLESGAAVLIIAGFVVVHREQLQVVAAEVERFAEPEITGLVLDRRHGP